jgi:peptide/nickel transport system substrate-binding protein
MESESSKSQQFSRRTLLERALVLGVAASLGGSLGQAAEAAVGTRRVRRATKTLVIGGDSIGGDWAPSHAFQGWAHYTAEAHMFDPLYFYPNGDITKPLVPVLASGLPVRGRKNKREYVVPLRKGVKFHDGTPFNAGSVMFDYTTNIDKTQQFYDAKAIFAGVNFILGVSKIDALDEHRVKFTLNRPLGDFTSQLVTFAGLMSPTSIRKNGLDNAALTPIGTGPYRFVEAVKGDHITLEANDDYFLGRPKIDRIVVRAIPDYAALTAALLSGEVDVSWFVNVNDVSAFQKNSNLNVAFRPGVVTGYVEFNAMGANGVSTFKDLRVRQAALHALDKRKLIATALHGYGGVGAGLNPQPSTGYQPDLRDYYKFDLNKAKSLLGAAGGGREVTLSVPSNLYWPLAGQVIQNDWNAAGLKTNLNVIDAAAFGSTMTQGKHDAFIWDATPVLFAPWALYNVLFNPTSAINMRSGGWVDQKFQRLLLAVLAAPDQTKVKKYIGQMDRLLLDNAIWQANYYPTTVSVYNKRLKGFRPPSAKFAIFTDAQVT